MAAPELVVVLMTAGGDEAVEEAVVRGHGGQLVKQLGDQGSMAIFTSAAEAVRCATELVGRLPAVRAGLSAGDAIQERGDWFGRPLVEAARLQAAAQPGQVLVTSVAFSLASARLGAVPAESVGDLQLKGLGLVQGVMAIRPGGVDDSRPPPPVLTDTRSAFVGRRDERAVLEAAWRTAAGGRRRVVLLTGEAGMGKSRLAEEFGTWAHGQGALVLAGRCAADVHLPYQPFVEALRSWAAQTTAGALRSVIGGEAGELVRLLPELATTLHAQPSPPAEPDAARLRLFEAVARLFNALAMRTPLVLIVDDLHWATEATGLLLRHLLDATAGAPLLLITTWRSDELRPALARMVADLGRDPDVTAIELFGLDDREAHLLSGSDAVVQSTGGNPLLLLEVAASGGDPDRPVTSLVQRRLSRLSTEAEAAVRVAAVVGLEFDRALVASVPDAGSDPTAVGQALEEAVAVGLVAPVATHPGRFRFGHALMRDAVYGSLTRTRRVRLHRRIATALSDRHEVWAIAARAHHAVEGAHPDSVADLAAATLAAARQAERSLAFEEATRHLERGLAAIDQLGAGPSHEVAELRLAAAWQHWLRFDGQAMRAEAVRAADAARACGSAQLLAEAACLAAEWVQAGELDALAVGLLEEALERLDGDELALRARTISLLVWHQRIGNVPGSEARSLHALELARQSGDPAARCQALLARISALNGRAAAEEAALADEMWELAVQTADVNLLINAHRVRPVCLLAVGRVAEVRDEVEEMRAIGTAGHRSFAMALAAAVEAQVLMMEGHFDRAEQLSAQAYEHSGGDVNFFNVYAGQMFWLASERGRLAGLLPMLDGLVGGGSLVGAFRIGRARARLATGDIDGAREDFRILSADDFALVSDDPTLGGTLAELIEVAVALDEHDALGWLRRQMAPWSGALVTLLISHVAGAGDRYLAEADAALGDLAGAEVRFAAALALEERAGARPLAARTRWAWAQALRRAGLDERAEPLEQEARRVADHLGMVFARAGS